MGFYPIRDPKNLLDKNVPLYDATILEKRSFAFGSQSLNCWDLVRHNPYTGDHPSDRSIAAIQCSSESEDFYAYFSGWRGDSEAFYKTLGGISIFSVKALR